MKNYNILKLQELKGATEVLRACPQISFSIANLINKNSIAIESSIKEYVDCGNLLKERGKSMDLNNPIEANKYREEINLLNSQEFSVDITPISSTEFIDINGDKEVPQADGSMRKFSYREAYFSLYNNVIFDDITAETK